jgi:excisionase family DNA binding protein
VSRPRKHPEGNGHQRPVPSAWGGAITGFGSEVFTTGQAAYILRVSYHTVADMADAGLIECYKIGVDDRQRRFSWNAVDKYMRERNIPRDRLPPRAVSQTLLLVGVSPELTAAIEETLPEGWEVSEAATLFLAGCRVAETAPAAIVFDCDAVGRASCREVVQALTQSGGKFVPKLIALVSLDDGVTEADFLSAGFDMCRGKAAGWLDVGELVASVTGNGAANGRKLS